MFASIPFFGERLHQKLDDSEQRGRGQGDKGARCIQVI